MDFDSDGFPQRHPMPSGILAAVQRCWQWSRALWRVLWLCRFSAALAAIGVYALLGNEQTQEVLREFAARDGFWTDFVEIGAFFAACFLWSWNSWSHARTLTMMGFAGDPPLSPTDVALRVWVPRVLGMVPAFTVPAALYLAAQPYAAAAPDSAAQMHEIALVATLGAVAFTVWMVARRRVDGARDAKEAVRSGYGEFNALPWFEKLTTLATVGVTCTLFVLFAWSPATTAPWFGAAAILLFAAASWITYGTALVYLSKRLDGMPLFALTVVLALIFSAWNDNHLVRTLAAMPMPSLAPAAQPAAQAASAEAACADAQAPASRRPLCLYAWEWLAARDDEIAAAAEGYRIYLVAAAGGGIRAAYWTAGTLAFRQDLDPTFAHRTFAISGVSGGSLGAMVFAGVARAQARVTSKGGRLAPDDLAGPWANQPVTSCATAVLAGDFLAPTLGAMLYPDLVQRFLWFPIPAFDRAAALESGWERRWRSVMGETDDWLGEPYDALSPPDPAGDVPLLLLNATVTETGQRALVSPIAVSTFEFPDTVDVRSLLPRPLRNSTAAHLSARFMYVSPAATVEVPGEPGGDRRWGHLVDGGYFENSGATTLADALNALNRAARGRGVEGRIVPTVLQLANDPREQAPGDTIRPPPDPLDVAVETLAPLETMLRTREGRGSFAQAALKRTVLTRAPGSPAGEFRFLRPDADGIPLPLGWMLSASARRQLDRQIILEGCAELPAACAALGRAVPSDDERRAIAAAPRCGPVARSPQR